MQSENINFQSLILTRDDDLVVFFKIASCTFIEPLSSIYVQGVPTSNLPSQDNKSLINFFREIDLGFT